ncbi:hypothetical protein ILYODFUR_009643 [Ilyodon furcidens]|uniref:Uncharacterized protein n=2 Tax=Goodeidae TaxID=28758 RepID=A0ABV0TIF3_9TELE
MEITIKHSQFNGNSAEPKYLEDSEQEGGEEAAREANVTNRNACCSSNSQALSRIQFAPLLLSVSSPSSHVPINFHDTQTQLHTEVDNILISEDTISSFCLHLVSVKGILWGECLG